MNGGSGEVLENRYRWTLERELKRNGDLMSNQRKAFPLVKITLLKSNDSIVFRRRKLPRLSPPSGSDREPIEKGAEPSLTCMAGRHTRFWLEVMWRKKHAT
ncbi:hypothetical protein NPIL_105101 [Nephila pilipes]|uniref:Uncharacterized protein n=1 Tax=Nephila pilipes TaxID=299642 RepID=A0A8X6N5C3_NEPPI|nr:hypothetical protein NPIL_105101 [Nephila pilipes]